MKAASLNSVGIIGGGILGISLGYYLTRAGVHVEIFEAGPEPGGLAGPMRLADGTEIDRFYHAILSSDQNLRSLCSELGISDQMRFKPTRMGFYDEGRIHSMNSSMELLLFPMLSWVDRFRLGLTVLAAMAVRDWRSLDTVSVEKWLLRWSGRNTYNTIWRPMLRAKFDGSFDRVPATWIWSRLVRIKSTRSGVEQKEEAGHIIGGYNTMLHAMVRQIEAAGGRVHLNTAVQEVQIEQGSARGLRLRDGRTLVFDGVVSTVQTPLLSRLVPAADESFRARLSAQEYLGILCPVLVLDKPLTGYWTLNITDESVPFTGVIETTAYIDPQYVGGHHLVYLPKYTAPGSEWQEKSDAEIKEIWLRELQRMFPEFDPATIVEFRVGRNRFVEPLHPLGGATHIEPVQTPVKNLFLATTAQIYPQLTNGESVTRHARLAVEQMLEAPIVQPAPARAVTAPVPA